MDNQSITHTRWNCTYHIVFIPKCRRKIMYGELKRDIVEIIKKLCEMKQVALIDGKVCRDHIHMYVAILPKMSVSEFMSYLKGKSTMIIFERYAHTKYKYGNRHFWSRGYYVSTVTYFYGHFLSSIATPPNSIFRFKRVLTGTAIIF